MYDASVCILHICLFKFPFTGLYCFVILLISFKFIWTWRLSDEIKVPSLCEAQGWLIVLWLVDVE